MSNDSAFNKRLTGETTMDQVEGLLEHFNLPPKAITYIRANQRMIQIVIAAVVIAVVVWSLYGSYRERVVEEAASSLSLAIQEDVASRSETLKSVVEKYGSTSSATWAQLELAHLDMKNNAFSDAAGKYGKILSDVKDSNPLYPLALFGLAHAFEADKKFQEATDNYNILREINGYGQLAFTGLGRIEEMQGNFEKALAVYNNYLLSLGDDPSQSQARVVFEGKIARLKAKQ
jgi:predicted negative regulator of RcsB-dependent stress response